MIQQNLQLATAEAPASAAAEVEPLDAMVARAQGGDRRAFDALYRELYPRVARRISHLVGLDAAAHDLIQETFVQAYHGLAGYRCDAPFDHWLLRIATNVARSHHRRRRRALWRLWDRPEVEAEVAAPGWGVDETFPHLQAVHRALDRLSAPLREAVILFELEGLTLQEIAEQLDIPLNTVASRLRRGRKRLRRHLEQLGFRQAPAVVLTREQEAK